MGFSWFSTLLYIIKLTGSSYEKLPKDYSGFKSCSKNIQWLAGWLLKHGFFWFPDLRYNSEYCKSLIPPEPFGQTALLATLHVKLSMPRSWAWSTQLISGSNRCTHIKDFIKPPLTLFFPLIRGWTESVSETQGDCSVQLSTVHGASLSDACDQDDRDGKQGWLSLGGWGRSPGLIRSRKVSKKAGRCSRCQNKHVLIFFFLKCHFPKTSNIRGSHVYPSEHYRWRLDSNHITAINHGLAVVFKAICKHPGDGLQSNNCLLSFFGHYLNHWEEISTHPPRVYIFWWIRIHRFHHKKNVRIRRWENTVFWA